MHTPLVPAGTSSLYVLFSLSAFITIMNPCLIIRKPVFNFEYCFVCIFSYKTDIILCVCVFYLCKCINRTCMEMCINGKRINGTMYLTLFLFFFFSFFFFYIGIILKRLILLVCTHLAIPSNS